MCEAGDEPPEMWLGSLCNKTALYTGIKLLYRIHKIMVLDPTLMQDRKLIAAPKLMICFCSLQFSQSKPIDYVLPFVRRVLKIAKSDS